MRSHLVGLDVWFLVGPFVDFHTSCVRTAKALAKLCGCTGSPESSLVACDKYHTLMSWHKSLQWLPATLLVICVSHHLSHYISFQQHQVSFKLSAVCFFMLIKLIYASAVTVPSLETATSCAGTCISPWTKEIRDLSPPSPCSELWLLLCDLLLPVIREALNKENCKSTVIKENLWVKKLWQIISSSACHFNCFLKTLNEI